MITLTTAPCMFPNSADAPADCSCTSWMKSIPGSVHQELILIRARAKCRYCRERPARRRRGRDARGSAHEIQHTGAPCRNRPDVFVAEPRSKPRIPHLYSRSASLDDDRLLEASQFHLDRSGDRAAGVDTDSIFVKDHSRCGDIDAVDARGQPGKSPLAPVVRYLDRRSADPGRRGNPHLCPFDSATLLVYHFADQRARECLRLQGGADQVERPEHQCPGSNPGPDMRVDVRAVCAPHERYPPAKEAELTQKMPQRHRRHKTRP